MCRFLQDTIGSSLSGRKTIKWKKGKVPMRSPVKAIGWTCSFVYIRGSVRLLDSTKKVPLSHMIFSHEMQCNPPTYIYMFGLKRRRRRTSKSVISASQIDKKMRTDRSVKMNYFFSFFFIANKFCYWRTKEEIEKNKDVRSFVLTDVKHGFAF